MEGKQVEEEKEEKKRYLGARGVSVLLSTGKDGVGKNRKDESGNVWFVPEFPASCPYLTAVGGTSDYDPEVAAPLSGPYNPEARGIPDIAA
ncbi:hypothetical protein EDB92DRAFT_1944284 [Lactarius akahatsu]|uniref:Uncharacterized protein n=1 Tax=Lactarius akahatsu TaxID=416441 RepID=A0AAD4QER6_9AGAM|nr:hypothetical protein EDB92DRAFT_1944284 [Lactarius akahatsu]